MYPGERVDLCLYEINGQIIQCPLTSERSRKLRLTLFGFLSPVLEHLKYALVPETGITVESTYSTMVAPVHWHDSLARNAYSACALINDLLGTD
jgi:hypothetical protein